MNESQYNDWVDGIFAAIEDALEELDLDFDQAEGVLTLECEDRSMIILSRQPATKEIWLAAKSGGYHLAHNDGEWLSSKTRETLLQLLNRVLTEQMGEPVSLDLQLPD